MAPPPSPVRLHPQLSEIYRRKVEQLSESLADPEIRPMALETIRGLIETVTINDTDSGVQIDLGGAITALVGLAQPDARAFITDSSVKVVSGVGYDLRPSGYESWRTNHEQPLRTTLSFAFSGACDPRPRIVPTPVFARYRCEPLPLASAVLPHGQSLMNR